jgi:hypothetical protein
MVPHKKCSAVNNAAFYYACKIKIYIQKKPRRNKAKKNLYQIQG